ncbi:anti-sigma B factor RsbW [Paenibacillus alvei]|uniref:anti-sigma B factor RsbW n=1 Tax=Paenibacillus alvei TaxID=44250 RepID=UPI0013DBD764|nr:anti-sigma B factor RsbW [Paenibacillus alvei]MBG9734807.1 serine/threonine protein kinase [Paenibacillus alvei]MBG9744682.1 serine/threonine protein kinase [Paenibacillus alvei]MCY9578902.1 anti-sigma B factor RsbW [Paenibacillus alvei]MCY9583958.1 anti-sigma B factor RsbW [Paenibacillus alvei]NEZ41432.1 anti-sigma B factor RsbW [Paenibacillus alvei]
MEHARELKRVKLSLPAQAEYVELARLTLYGIASRIGFSYEDIEDMKVAISEACNNAVLYAYDSHGGVVEVLFEVAKDEIEIIVQDEGASFDAASKTNGLEALHDKQLEDIQAGGLGFYLMQALMDEVEVKSVDGHGTVVKMKKRLQQSGELL